MCSGFGPSQECTINKWLCTLAVESANLAFGVTGIIVTYVDTVHSNRKRERERETAEAGEIYAEHQRRQLIRKTANEIAPAIKLTPA